MPVISGANLRFGATPGRCVKSTPVRPRESRRCRRPEPRLVVPSTWTTPRRGRMGGHETRLNVSFVRPRRHLCAARALADRPGLPRLDVNTQRFAPPSAAASSPATAWFGADARRRARLWKSDSTAAGTGPWDVVSGPGAARATRALVSEQSARPSATPSTSPPEPPRALEVGQDAAGHRAREGFRGVRPFLRDLIAVGDRAVLHRPHRSLRPRALEERRDRGGHRAREGRLARTEWRHRQRDPRLHCRRERLPSSSCKRDGAATSSGRATAPEPGPLR
jgi:hypothetical protein